jgi:anti-sigma factor RsiW
MNDIWTNRLSEYLDGELDNEERAALEAHLATCGQCYATLGELSQVVTRAKALHAARKGPLARNSSRDCRVGRRR